jgi:uncharacterized protein (TIGR02452 family)
MHVSRSNAAQMGREADRILAAGHYTTEAGAVVRLADALERAVQGTRSYAPEDSVPRACPGEMPTAFEVVNETTLAAARRLVAAGHRPVALNFASAKHPGGGYRSGARAQEESLARSSGLVPCLVGNPMYERHRWLGDALYTDSAIYSSDVPVFRADDGTLLAEPYLCAFITCPAVNAKVVLARSPGRRGQVRDAMASRIDRVLRIAAAHGHDAAVLGAWGCGVFGNDPREIAGLFRQALDGPFAGVFARVAFAVVDWSDERRFIGPFERAFTGRG